MDCFNAKRAQLVASIEKAFQNGAAKQKDRKSGQKNLFDDMLGDDAKESTAAIMMPNVAEWDEKTLLAAEKEVLGYYLSAHPLAGFQHTLSTFCSHTTIALKSCKDREEVMVGGMISSIKLAHTKNPKPGQPSKYANFDLEDVEGMVRCILWPDGFASSGHFIIPDAVVLLRAAADRRGGGDEINLIVNEVIPIEEADARFTSGVQVYMDAEKHHEDAFQRLREILRGYPGTRDVLVSLRLEKAKSSTSRAANIVSTFNPNSDHDSTICLEAKATSSSSINPS